MESEKDNTHTKGLEGPLEEEETCVFARPSVTVNEETCAFVHPSEKESEADMSDSSHASTASGSQARKRRQPYLCKPGKAKKPAVNKIDVMDPYDMTARAKRDLPTAEDIQRELKTFSPVDIKDKICESMSTVERVVDSSRNLKGAQAQNLRMAARSAIAAAAELAERFSSPEVEELKRENAELRSELSILKSQLVKVTAEISSLRNREAGVNKATEQSEGIAMRRDQQGNRIAILMDRKLAEFRAEMFAEVVDKSHSGKEPKTGKAKAKKIKRKPRNGPQVPQLVVPEAPSSLVGCDELEQSPNENWARVVARKAKTVPSDEKRNKGGTKRRISAPDKMAKPPPTPRTAAVTITLSENATESYGTVMAAAKNRVKLSDCGISQVRQKKGITGGLVLEVPGPDCSTKADALAERLRVALTDMGVRIARPVKTGEIRVMDLDDSITKQEVAEAIAKEGGCSPEKVKVGAIRFNTHRLGTVWVRCPLTAVRKLAEDKHVQVGWVRARVRLLEARQLQCYRCLEMGHARSPSLPPHASVML